MELAITLKLLLTVAILILHPKVESQWVVPRPVPRPPLPQITPTPFCSAQFALVNHACESLPFVVTPPPSPPSPPAPPASPPPPPLLPPPPPVNDSRHHHHHHHHHEHHQVPSPVHQRRAVRGTPDEEYCCRWLREVDNVCVCDVLVRLPSFLTRPIHNYTVVVSNTCSVTFSCGSRLVRF